MQIIDKEVLKLSENLVKKHFVSSLTYWKFKFKARQVYFEVNENQLFSPLDVF